MRFPVLLILAVAVLTGCTSHKIESQLRHAEELIGTRRFEEALRVYQSAVKRYPDSKKTAISYLKMGDLYYYTMGKGEDALAAYSEVIRRWPISSQACDAHLRRAEIYEVRGELRRAINDYEEILMRFPHHKERYGIMLKKGRAYLNMQDPYQAAVELEELLEGGHVENEIRRQALFDLGESYLFLKEYKKALEAFKKFEEDFSDSPQVLDAELRMVECLEKLDRVDEAIKLQQELVKRYPESEVIRRKIEGLVRREEKVERPD